MSKYHIVQLRAQNVLRIKAVSLEPDGNTIIIGGNNAEGKSSTLDCIEMCLRGAGSIPPEPIHRGASKGEITLKLRDEIKNELDIKRTFTAKGSQLKVTRKGGGKVESPQKLLDTLVGNLSFDPLSFAEGDSPEDDRRREDIYKNLTGLDFEILDQRRKKYYDRRTEVGRDQKRIAGQLEGHVFHDDAPDEPVSVKDLMEELSKAQSTNTDNLGWRNKVEMCQDEIKGKEEEVERAKEDLKELHEKLANEENELESLKDDLSDAVSRAKGQEDIDTQPIKDKIDGAEAINDKVRENEEHRELQAEAKEVDEKSAKAAFKLCG